jgi:hypothetical protein
MKNKICLFFFLNSQVNKKWKSFAGMPSPDSKSSIKIYAIHPLDRNRNSSSATRILARQSEFLFSTRWRKKKGAELRMMDGFLPSRKKKQTKQRERE